MNPEQSTQLAEAFVAAEADVFAALRQAQVALALRASENLVGELAAVLANGGAGPAALVVAFIQAAQTVLGAAGSPLAASWLADLAPALRRFAADLLDRPLRGDRLDGLADLR